MRLNRCIQNQKDLFSQVKVSSRQDLQTLPHLYFGLRCPPPHSTCTHANIFHFHIKLLSASLTHFIMQTAEMERDRLNETVSQRNRMIADQSSRLTKQEEMLELSQNREHVLTDQIESLKQQLEQALSVAKNQQAETPAASSEVEALKEEVRRLTEALGASDTEAGLRSKLNDSEKKLERH